MIRVASLRRWLMAPPVGGSWAFFWSIAAVAVPTVLCASVNRFVSGAPITPYFPSVLLAAIFLGWAPAALIALTSAIVADMLFIGGPYAFLEGPRDVFAVAVFLSASAMMIAFVAAVRWLVRGDAANAPAEASRGIIFSLEDGQAWASWSGHDSQVRLGAKDEVAEMMEDFLAQLEVGKRLTGQSR